MVESVGMCIWPAQKLAMINRWTSQSVFQLSQTTFILPLALAPGGLEGLIDQIRVRAKNIAEGARDWRRFLRQRYAFLSK